MDPGGSEGLYLGFDVGTQATKGVVLDATTARVIARGGSSYGLIPNLPRGAAEQDPQTWVRAVREVAAELLSASGVERVRIRGLGVSGQQHGLVVLDVEDRIVRPAKLWCDTTTEDEAQELSEDLRRAIPAGFTAPKTLWMKRHEPELWGRVHSVLLPHDYINFRLTGRKTMEAGDASGTGFFDPVTRAFDSKAIERIDSRLAEMLPPVLPPGSPAGVLSAQGADLLGLREGMLVAAGGGDNMMSAIGSGARSPGVVVVSLGTSETAFAYSDRPLLRLYGGMAAAALCHEHDGGHGGGAGGVREPGRQPRDLDPGGGTGTSGFRRVALPALPTGGTRSKPPRSHRDPGGDPAWPLAERAPLSRGAGRDEPLHRARDGEDEETGYRRGIRALGGRRFAEPPLATDPGRCP